MRSRRLVFSLVLFVPLVLGLSLLSAREKPNVLFIAIDDQNDWIDPLTSVCRSTSPRTGTRHSPPADFAVRGPRPGVGTRPPEKLIPPTPMGDHPLMDWGAGRSTTTTPAKANTRSRAWRSGGSKLPTADESPTTGSAHRILTYDPATDQAIWEGRKITRDDPIPQ